MTLKINNLSKTYPNGVKALDNLNLEIKQGMFGLLGPNGAGKSSLMRTLATLQPSDEGSVFFEDIDILKDPMELRKILGYLPQDFGVYPKMSAEDLLEYLATLKGIASKQERNALIKQVLEITNLYEVRKKSVDGYSGGMKQRFGIAQLLLNNPKLIIVDEPTAGLDPAERNRFLNVLREIASSNIIIFSTHIVDDIKDLCNDMAIMNGGKILKKIMPSEATKEIESKIWTSNIDREKLEEAEQAFFVLSSKYNQDNSVNIRVYANEQPSSNFASATPNLEDVYFIALKNNLKN
ncbi:MAG TPA: ABC transporter ATP-binding protein [bacterium]|nr:ABC transporter ATP-binding protein [bacterium]HNO91146.1 ABC transporter ATP-binding protein [bacterium]